jgi:MraZ protein
MLFQGRSFRSLDAKGRIMLPPAFREILQARSESGKFVLTTFVDNCIAGFPLPDWNEFVAKIYLEGEKMPPGKFRNVLRLVIGGAEEMVADAQGRVRLSREYLAHAGISGEVVLLGQRARFELWNPARLESATSSVFDDVAVPL